MSTLSIFGNISSLLGTALTIAVGVGVYRLLYDITWHRDNKHIKSRMKKLLKMMGGNKPLTSDANDQLKDVLDLVEKDYVSWWNLSRKERLEDVKRELPLTNENRERIRSRLVLLDNAVLVSKDFYDE